MFKIKAEDKNARTGTLKTKHGKVKTPCFMPVATKGAAKLITAEELKEMGAEALISNAFILSLRPGLEVIENHKGLHKFMKWDKTIFTDCGGFQSLLGEEFYLGANKEGISFKSPFDGKRHLITPKKILDIQKTLGSDVAMALDDMPAYGSPEKRIVESMKNTHRWMEECKNIHDDEKQLLFGIAQGGTFPELRKKSTQFIDGLDFDGIAFGGLCIGEQKKEMFEMVKISVANCSKDKPHYLMGVGSPPYLLECISLGVDVFDSVFPTRNARHGHVFTVKGFVNIENAPYKTDCSKLDEGCRCDVCRKHTKAYLHHLLRTKEPLGLRLLSYHNLFFLQELMKKARKHIEEGTFEEFRKEFTKSYSPKNS